MPGSYLIDVANGIVYSRGWGVITNEQVAEHATTLRADPRFDPGFRQIVDFRELERVQLTGAGVRDIARVNPFRRDARRAFVVGTDEAFGVTRMFGFFTDSDDEQFRTFRFIEPAFEWIGLDPASPWPARAPDRTFGG